MAFKVKNLIDNAYKSAIEERYINGNPPRPCRIISLNKVESKTPEILPLEEIKKFLTAAQAVRFKMQTRS